jgi:hypothetical protein
VATPENRRKSRRIGRPPLDPALRTIRVSVALQRKDAEELDAAAKKRGVSLSSIVARLVQRWLVRHRRK